MCVCECVCFCVSFIILRNSTPRFPQKSLFATVITALLGHVYILFRYNILSVEQQIKLQHMGKGDLNPCCMDRDAGWLELRG
jgi:hypothetical protein